MVRSRWVVSIALAVALSQFGLAQTPATHPVKRKSAKSKPVKQFVLPPMPPGPLPQVPLDQLPAVPPEVSYQGGNLTIVAENSTLGDILKEVRKRTGASIDVPGNASERVATRLGPGSARDVLATLLNGTSFNYVMVGSPNDPATLSSVVLTPRPASSGAVQTAQAQPAPVYTAPNFGPGTGRPGFVPPQAAPPQAADNDEDKDDDEADNAEDQQQQQAEGQPGQPGIPSGLPQPQVQQPDGTDPNGQPNGGPRTPQQILQMLQQQRQQQQQQQQQNQDQSPPEQ